MGKDIKKEISKLEQKIEELKALDNETKKIRLLESYTTKEKIEKFESLYQMALDIFHSRLNGEWHEDNDDRYYAWEAVMKLLGDNFFDVWNKLPNSYDR